MAKNSYLRVTVTAGAVSVLFTAAMILLMVFQLQPPPAVPAGAPAGEFSSGRAMEHLRIIARAPHPTGSPQNAAVRDFILNQMRALGLETQLQTATAVQGYPRRRGAVVGATVENVVCRLQGTAGTKSLMLVAHYDSVPTSPGASDDGAGVVTLIETARALRSGPALRNTVIFLFTDGEELGLLGARAFVDQHPWAKEVGLVINFEARGAGGPSLLFETSERNGELIRHFARAALHPMTSSFFYEFYRRMPNDTDLSVFKSAGYPGLNFSYARGWPRYHTAGDSTENLDERSLQHHGTYALSLARYFGDRGLADLSHGDAVYFSLLGRVFHYPGAWVIPSTVFLSLLFLSVLALGLKTGVLKWSGLGCSMAAWLGSAVAAAAAAQFAWTLLRGTPLASMLPYGMAYNSELYAAGFLAMTVAIATALCAALSERMSPETLTVGALFLWLALAVAAALYAPGASYVFVWPSLAGLMVLVFTLPFRGGPGLLAIAWALPAAIAILLFAPVPYLLAAFMTTSGLAPMTVAVALLSAFLTPLAIIMIRPARWWLPGAAATLALFLIVLATTRSAYHASRPRATSLFYHLDSDTGEAMYASMDTELNSWTSMFLQDGVERRNLGEHVPFDAPALTARAPTARLDPPLLSVLEDASVGDLRVIRLRIRSARQARALWISGDGSRVLGGTVNGKEVAGSEETRGRPWRLYYAGLPQEGIVLSLAVRRDGSLGLRVTDVSDGLPAIEGKPAPPRPDHLMASPALPFDTATMVSRNFARLGAETR